MNFFRRLIINFIQNKILKVQQWAIRALYYHIQIMLLGNEKYSLNKKEVEIANALLFKFFELPKENKHLVPLEKESKEEYHKLLLKLLNDDLAKEIASSYYRAMEFYNKMFHLNNTEFYSQKALEFKANSKPIKDWKELKKYRDELRKLAKERMSKKNDLQTFKISVSMTDFLAFISLSGTLFIITGFLKNYLLFKTLGLDITPFFGIQDYLTTSLSSILNLFVGASLGLISVFFGINSRIKDPEPIRKIENIKMNRGRNILLIGFVAIAIFGYLVAKEYLFQLYLIIYILIILEIIPRFAFRYFKNGVKAMFVLLFLSYYVGEFVIQHVEDISTINTIEVNSYVHINLT